MAKNCKDERTDRDVPTQWVYKDSQTLYIKLEGYGKFHNIFLNNLFFFLCK